MRSCYEESLLRSFIQCELDEDECAQIEAHISECTKCRELLERLECEAEPMFRIANSADLEDSMPAGFSQFWDEFSRYAESEEQLDLPQSIGLYELQSVLGKGGMGIVYQAEHKMLHRKVAVKFIRHKKIISPEITERFHQEIISAGRLFHPNVVTTMDAGNFNGKPYLVMELLEGENLAQRIQRDGPLPMTEAVSILLQACRGIQHAHSFGLLHCDVKPSNLWLQPDGNVKVLDLGMTQLRSALNDSVHYGGTPHFMSTEQRKQLPIDERTDIYSLGCTLYFMLTGKLPKEDGTDRLDVSQSGIRIPRSLQKVIQKMAHPEKEQRFKFISDVKKALLPFSTEHSTKLLISTAYISMLLSLLILPPFFGIIAFVLGFVNKKKGSTFHGKMQIWMAPVCMGVGMAVGMAVWHTTLMEEYLLEEFERIENRRKAPQTGPTDPESFLVPPLLLENTEMENGSDAGASQESGASQETGRDPGTVP